jgi:hypothetical protein
MTFAHLKRDCFARQAASHSSVVLKEIQMSSVLVIDVSPGDERVHSRRLVEEF